MKKMNEINWKKLWTNLNQRIQVQIKRYRGELVLIENILSQPIPRKKQNEYLIRKNVLKVSILNLNAILKEMELLEIEQKTEGNEKIPEHLTYSYLKCKNQMINKTILGKELQLPLCPECERVITGGEYFQDLLDQPRMHLKCFFDKHKANDHYKTEFLQDSLFKKLTLERTERWKTYLAENGVEFE